MKKTIAVGLLGVLSLGLMGGVAPVSADDAATDPDLLLRAPFYSIEYEVNKDGSFTEKRSWSRKILQEKGLARYKQTSISWSTSVEKADILEAYTLKANGKKIKVPKDNFQVETNTGKGKDAPIFSDRTEMTIVFPEVAVGDSLVLSYKLTAREPMFAGHFSDVEVFSRRAAYDDVRVKFDLPKDLWVQFEARELKEVTNTEKRGRRILEWTWQNPVPEKSKRRDYSVYDIEKEPGVSLSTFHNYQELAEAYGVVSRPKAVVTPRVQQLADQIAGDKTAPRENARVLYEWVAKNISYAGNCVGLGAVVPHNTDFILDNHMGDCKDHATLLQALLAARHIPSAQALVNAGSSYKLQKIPVVSMVNHVINYIPSLDLYVDSTSDDTPFGYLPGGDEGKPVLLVGNYREGARTPVTKPGVNDQLMKSTVAVQADGSVKADVAVSLKGHYAVQARSSFRDMNKEVEKDLVKNALQSQKMQGEGTFHMDDAKPLLDVFSYGASLDVKNVVSLPGSGAFSVDPLFFSWAPVSRYTVAAVADFDNEQDVRCGNGHTVEEYTYRFPKQMKILAVPDDLKLSNDFLSYNATYKLKGDTLQVRREFDDRTQDVICSKDAMQRYKDFAQKVLQNQKSQVVYKM